jgi:uncharacterized membrane protein
MFYDNQSSKDCIRRKYMFNRPKYKEFARIQLKKRWALPIIMTLITFAITALLEVPYTRNLIDFFEEQGTVSVSSFWTTYKQIMESYKETTLERICGWASFFITAIITVAQYYVYLKMSRGPEPVHFGDFMEGFSNWWRAVLASLWMYFWIILWTLLFVIPGIVKMIAYSQTYFIITEFPEIPVTKALDISKLITKGFKGDLFIMWMSFIGWGFLCCLSCGIGFIWLIPYINMSMTNAYHGLMKHALETKIITAEDLKQ